MMFDEAIDAIGPLRAEGDRHLVAGIGAHDGKALQPQRVGESDHARRDRRDREGLRKRMRMAEARRVQSEHAEVLAERAHELPEVPMAAWRFSQKNQRFPSAMLRVMQLTMRRGGVGPCEVVRTVAFGRCEVEGSVFDDGSRSCRQTVHR